MRTSPLVIYNKQLGDVLLLEPALAKLAESTGTEVMLATRPAFAPMLSLMDRVRPLPSGIFRRSSSVISFDHRLRACLFALTTLSPEKRLVVGNSKRLRGWHRLFFPTQCSVVPESAQYRAEYCFDAMPVTSNMAFRPPKLNRPPVTWLPPNLPERYILVHPTSAWKRKSWSAERWGKALDALHARGMGPFVVTGGSAEWEQAYVAEMQRFTQAPLINLCGNSSLEAYMATVANAQMVLCIDGSAAHLAAAFQRPLVVLFGPTHPLHWYYPTEHSLLIDAREFVQEERPAVDNIPVDAVVEAAGRLWDRRQ